MGVRPLMRLKIELLLFERRTVFSADEWRNVTGASDDSIRRANSAAGGAGGGSPASSGSGETTKDSAAPNSTEDCSETMVSSDAAVSGTF
jgi:hypothetical protein